MTDPRITDNDHGEITATVNGKEVRGWSYKDDAERRVKMLMAHEFAEGWFQCAKKSAASDLLSALKATRIYVETLEKHLDPVIDPGASTIREHGAMLRAAIAKAERAP